jgi:hypothetical protein
VPPRERVSEGEDDRERNHRAFVGFFPARAVDTARVAPDELVVDSGFHDGVQEAVRPGHGDRPEWPGGRVGDNEAPM